MEYTRTIIIIEDDHETGHLLKEKFQKHGFNVELFEDGFLGFRAIEENNPKLVILDLNVPGMDGMMILRKLDEKSELSHIPIIILTNETNESKRLQARYYGAFDYLIKTEKTLEEIIEKAGTLAFR